MPTMVAHCFPHVVDLVPSRELEGLDIFANKVIKKLSDKVKGERMFIYT
jgi:hypothetical protein